MYLGDLQSKDIININTGKNIGRISDVEINKDGVIKNILVENTNPFKSFLKGKESNTIRMDQIVKIGEDVILVNM